MRQFGTSARNAAGGTPIFTFRAELYATASVVSGVVYVSSLNIGLSVELALFVAIALGLLLRLLAMHFHSSIPKFIYRDT